MLTDKKILLGLFLVCLSSLIFAGDRAPTGDAAEPALFFVKNHSAMGLQPGNLVLIGREPIGEVTALDLAEDGEILITFKTWRTFQNSLLDNMLVYIRKNKRSAKVVFVPKQGGRVGERVPAGTMFHAAKKHHVWNRRYVGNPSRNVAGKVSRGVSNLRGGGNSAEQDH
ncbi:hypothetical protein [Acanthopleuribacter pedis]|uniref:Uncharacterized protein n=1 Tax=Acanthopleuribacter pedis TaxID=442870 RepID=A0A8J7QEP6_9BACT|nr:hypothetical protein [Acanthopleuribacter pedis]MBO1316990.1 hypothetical protein [Acanthopleuribacter pedis]